MNPLLAMIDGHPRSKDYSMLSKRYRHLLLKNTLTRYIDIDTTRFGQERTNGILVDPKTEYSINSFGYRDIDWIGKAEILAVGCSNTWGYGVPVDGRWTNILGEKINKEIRNLSFPGGSINDLVAKSFEYFKIFGNPEIMLCLFPDPFRLRLPVKKNIIKEFMPKKEDKEYIPPDLTFGDIQLDVNPEPTSQKNKYIKRPYTYREILPLEVPLFFSMQAIHLLEQYCRSNNIKLIWSSWHPLTVTVLNNDKENIFSNVVFNKDLVIDYGLVEDCHKEYENYFKEWFHLGGDVEDGVENAHPGVHKHIHIAEAFYEEMNK